MALQDIDLGASLNDEDSGDFDGNAWQKVIINFSELGGDGRAVADNSVLMDNLRGAIVGSNLNVRTGNFTIVDTNAKNINTAIIFHSGGKPTYTGGVIVGELGEYAAGVVNLISLIRIAPGKYLANYGGEIKNLVTTGGGDTTAPGTPGIATITDEGDAVAPGTPGTATITNE